MTIVDRFDVFLFDLDESQRARLAEALRVVERLLTAGLVEFDVADPTSPDARHCLDAYFDELDGRFGDGFDPDRSISADADELTEAGGTAMDFDLARSLEILERTPGVLRALLEDLSGDWTTPNEGADTFSAFDNAAHLAQTERVNWIQRAEIILEHGTAVPFPRLDPYAHQEASQGESMAEVLDGFAALRAENLSTLRGWDLSEEQLGLEGEHPDLGRVDLRQLLSTWTAHDLSHLAQIARVLSKQYREAVGPWRAYLPILDR